MEYEATMFALFAFKVLMGENHMRKLLLRSNEVAYFPTKIGNCGTFVNNSEQWEAELNKFLDECCLTDKRYCFTVITPPTMMNSPSHYLGLIIDLANKNIYTFDSLSECYCKRTINAVENWAFIKSFKYLKLHIPWQNTETEQDAWCQTWTLLFQKCLIQPMIQFNPREELIKLVKTKGPNEFEKALEDEYQAQLNQHCADPRMKKFNARKLIDLAKYHHFFEPY